MARNPDKTVTRKKTGRIDAASRRLKAAEVRDYLNTHADFLVKNQDLLAVLTLPDNAPTTGDNIADFQRFALTRLKDEVREMGANQGRLLAATRSNLASQQQIHDAVLMALAAGSLEVLVHTVTFDWVDTLGVDAIAICFENELPTPALTRTGMRRLTPGTVDELLGTGEVLMLRGEVEGATEIFGPAAPLVKAEALVRMDLGDKKGNALLAFGSRDTTSFYPGQGTELLRFLKSVLEHCLSRCLKQRV